MIGGDASDRRARSSLRLEGYDYGAWGPYFVSIVVDNRRPLFGEVVDEELRLNAAGEMAESVWAALPRRFPAVRLDAFVVMPNHIHGIIVIDHSDTVNTTERATTRVAPTGAPDAGRRTALGDVVGAYKSLTTVEYTRGVAVHGWPRFRGRLWQRNYYEHIIRDDRSLERIRAYILDNPARWPTDPENPSAVRR